MGINNLHLSHMVVSEQQGLIFASCRDASDRIYNFIVNVQAGIAFQQVRNHFEAIGSEYSEGIKELVSTNIGIVPTYNTREIALS